MNFTIPVPAGTTDHGQPGLLCVPPAWTDMFAFFATNYFAHAATVLAEPGQSFSETVMNVVSALFVPGFGALRPLRYLILHPVTIRDNLQRAAASGALCMVTRREWRQREKYLRKNGPEADVKMCDEVQGSLEMQPLHSIKPPRGTEENASANAVQDAYTVADGPANEHVGAGGKAALASTKPSSQAAVDWYSRIFETGIPNIVSPHRRFHGRIDMPKGGTYELTECPPDTPFKAYGATAGAKGALASFHIGASYSVPKILIGLSQAVWAVFTLYRVRGDQLDLYGYAAFGLTVAPYAFMSIINIIANLVTPEYATMFLVHTPDLDEAREAGGKFVGVIAAVDIDEQNDHGKRIELGCGPKRFRPEVGLALIVFVTPLAIVGALSSKFQPGSISTAADRGWLMSWLVIGSASSVWPLFLRVVFINSGNLSHFIIIAYFLLMSPVFVPAIGGMVTVGRMLQSYGVCTDLRS